MPQLIIRYRGLSGLQDTSYFPKAQSVFLGAQDDYAALVSGRDRHLSVNVVGRDPAERRRMAAGIYGSGFRDISEGWAENPAMLAEAIKARNADIVIFSMSHKGRPVLRRTYQLLESLFETGMLQR